MASKLIYFSKNSWWDARKARKVLLPLAFAQLEGCSSVLVNAAVVGWRRSEHPPAWCHPDAEMTVLSPVRWLPLQRFGVVRRINQWLRWRMARRFMGTEGSRVVILSDPEDMFIARFARRAGMACWFDWTEEWDAYAHAAGSVSQARASVDEIFSWIDGVIVVSRLLEQKAQAMGLKRFHLQNAVAESFIHALEQHRNEDVPAVFRDIPAPRAVHVGSCNPAWIDWDCLIRAAEENLGVSFCMIGGGGEDKAPADLPGNIYLLGYMAYEELPAILAHCDLCLLLYRPEETAGNDPTKLYEYLASGKPIVSTPHPRAMEFGEWIRIADSPEAFAREVRESLADRDATLETERRRIVHEHTWRCRTEVLRGRLF